MPMQNEHLKLGTILVNKGFITENQLNECLELLDKFRYEARTKGTSTQENKKIGDILLQKQYITPKNLAIGLQEQFNVDLFDKTSLGKNEVDMNTVRRIKDVVAKEIGAMILKKEPNGSYFVVATDPGDLRTKIRLKTLLNTELSNLNFHVMAQDDFDTLYNNIYKFNMSIEDISRERENERKSNEKNTVEINDNNAISSIIDTILSTAISERASDIHIESIDQKVIVRYRIDTIPVIKHEFPKDIENMIITKFLIACNVGLDKRNIPLDGRFERTFNGKKYDFRVNFLPVYLPDRTTTKVAIRILNRDKLAADIKKIGFTESTFDVYDRMVHEPHGLILVVGPMGSGKTTTLYSTIAYLNPKGKEIITLEDPPEFSIQYVNQCKITPEVGFTYESGLKAILRQDADIILVGEIRDGAVGKLAIQSAEIGRLVFSTLHVDNAVSSVLRLNNLGIAPFFVSSVLVGVVSQRLVRRICPHCGEIYHPNPADIRNASALLDVDLSQQDFIKGKGCQYCGGTGYSGLIPTYEVLNFKEITPLREAVSSGTLSTEKLQDIAVANGYKPMIYDAYEKVAKGFTTFEEVNRIVLDANQRKLIEKELIKKKII